jgi:very-short-patch-repair endonuclease
VGRADPSAETNHPRDLRRRQTDAERLLWRNLRRLQLEVKFRRQHPIAGYIVDFYCAEAQLAVELDGGGHAGLDQARYDRVRAELLECIGVKLLRFWNNEVFDNLDGVLETILKEVLTRR